jgi:hypothetical protein
MYLLILTFNNLFFHVGLLIYYFNRSFSRVLCRLSRFRVLELQVDFGGRSQEDSTIERDLEEMLPCCMGTGHVARRVVARGRKNVCFPESV